MSQTRTEQPERRKGARVCERQRDHDSKHSGFESLCVREICEQVTATGQVTVHETRVRTVVRPTLRN